MLKKFAFYTVLVAALLVLVERSRAANKLAADVIVGTSTLNFGTTPGGVDSTVTVTGLGSITAASHIDARISLNTATADHGADEHRVESIKVSTGNIVAGTGFTIYGEVLCGRAYGQWTVEWECY